MKLVAIMPVRNEAWILGSSLRALLMWVDEVAVLCHACTDASLNIMGELQSEVPGRIHLAISSDPLWEEMDHRQLLLECARVNGATHIVTVDADEILSGNLLPSIQSWVEQTPVNAILQVPWVSCRGALDRYHTSGIWSQQDVSIAWRDNPRCHWAARNGYHFHHRHPMGPSFIAYTRIRGVQRGGLMHLQFVSDRRLRAKQALYLMQEVTRWPGRMKPEELNRMYGLAVYGSYDSAKPDLQTAQAPAEWWAPYQHLMRYIDVDAEPWQEAECRRLWKEHGAATFSGLDLFGVVG